MRIARCLAGALVLLAGTSVAAGALPPEAIATGTAPTAAGSLLHPGPAEQLRSRQTAEICQCASRRRNAARLDDLDDVPLHGVHYEGVDLGINWWATSRWKLGTVWGRTWLVRDGLKGRTDMAPIRGAMDLLTFGNAQRFTRIAQWSA